MSTRMLSGQAPRLVNALLGAWLFVSAFVWPHSPAEMAGACVVGALCITFACVATVHPSVRYLNTALAIWLLFSDIALPSRSVATAANALLVGVLVFIVSLVPTPPLPPRAHHHVHRV
jgi:hypothetical protein